jgi:transcriptional regulator with XRE-family HTH domain
MSERDVQGVLLGQLMGQAMQEAGLKSGEVARRMGLSDQSTIDRWVRGERVPLATYLARFAEVVGKPMEYFFGATRGSLQRTLADAMLDFADMVMGAGRSAPGALERVFGQAAPISDEERRRLAEATPAIREGIRRLAGMDWDLLSETQKREVLDQVLALYHERAAAPDSV